MSQATQASREIGAEVPVITLRAASLDGTSSTRRCSVEVLWSLEHVYTAGGGGGVHMAVLLVTMRRM
jgi:hypothetical protein